MTQHAGLKMFQWTMWSIPCYSAWPFFAAFQSALKRGMMGAVNKESIPADIAARYTNSDQAERVDKAVRKIFSVSPKRAAIIRGEASVNPSPRGRSPKGIVPASRVPVAAPHV